MFITLWNSSLSLRAEGVAIPVANEVKQSPGDCFVANAPRNDKGARAPAMTRKEIGIINHVNEYTV